MPDFVLNVLQGPVSGSWTQTNSSRGDGASRLQATRVSFGAEGGHLSGKPYLRGSIHSNIDNEHCLF